MALPVVNLDMAITPPIKRWIQHLQGRVDQLAIDSALFDAQQGRLEGAREIFKRANKQTRLELWRACIQDDKAGETVFHGGIEELAKQEDPATKRSLLLHCLKNGWTAPACRLVEMGAPTKNYSTTPGVNKHGALAGLMYNKFPDISSRDRVKLASLMMDAGEMRCFNPGLIVDHDVFLAFLERAPASGDTQAWKAFLWAPEDYTRTQVAFDTDPRNVVSLLERGFPGIAIDLVARALACGNQAHASALVDWAGKDLTQPPNEPTISTFDFVTEQPVLAEGFWHMLADAWARRMHAVQTQNWDPAVMDDCWPHPPLLARLLDYPALQPSLAIDGEGRTPAQRAQSICGQAGPIEQLESLWQERQLETRTGQAIRLHGRRARL